MIDIRTLSKPSGIEQVPMEMVRFGTEIRIKMLRYGTVVRMEMIRYGTDILVKAK